MTAIAIFGEFEASSKLVSAALYDIYEAHLADAPDEEFRLFVGIPKTMPIYSAILAWAVRNSVPVDIYLSFDSKVLQNVYAAQLEVRWHRSDNYMMELVRALDTQPSPRIYALLGDQEPSVAVRRALVRALDNGLEVRDLAEAGLTIVGVADNPIRQGSTTMADDLMTLEAAGQAADEEGDTESIQALTEFAEQHGIDPDDYPTWTELAQALDPLLAAAETETEDEAPAASGGLTAEELEDKSVPELRNLAKQLGVDGWETNRSTKLIQGILAAQGSGAAAPKPVTKQYADEQTGSVNGISAEALARGLRAFADALEG
jgi:nucleotide-binding universal stress UspA family protein